MWGNSVALAWTWGIGLFFTVQTAVQMGFLALITYVSVNAFGLTMFGVINEFIARKFKTPADYENAFLNRAYKFKFGFLFYQFLAIALTIFACMKYVTLPLGILSILVAVMFLGAVIYLGEEFEIRRIKYSHLIIGIGVISLLIYIFTSEFIQGYLPAAFNEPGVFSYDSKIEQYSMWLPIAGGFLFGPWLDYQHWQRAIQIRKENLNIASSYVVGGLIFWCFLMVNGILAIVAYENLTIVDQAFSSNVLIEKTEFIYSFKDIITQSLSKSNLTGILNAYIGFVCLASLATFDSGYIATKWFITPLVNNSKSMVYTFVPQSLVKSPIPWFILAIVVATTTLHFSQIGHFIALFDPSLEKFFRFELEYYLAFYATFFVVYEITLARSMISKNGLDYAPLTQFATATTSLAIFGIGYFAGNFILMGIAALIPVIYGLSAGKQAEKEIPELGISEDKVVENQPATQDEAIVTSSKVIYPASANVEVGANGVAVYKSYYIHDQWFIHMFTPTYQDTNSVGNIYWAMYAMWVGKTRELMFDYCMPEFDPATSPFLILTKSFQHKFLREIKEFMPVTIHIKVKSFNRKFVTLEHKILDENQNVIGKGEQDLMFVASASYKLIDIPEEVLTAFLPFTA